jgi:uncharacterized membrane protein YraQ (UPF0718 family)
LVGFLTSLFVGVGIVTVGQRVWTSATTAYLFPGEFLAGWFGRFVPDAVIYSAVPEGGASAFLFVSLVFAFLFWSCCVAAFYFYVSRIKRRSA